MLYSVLYYIGILIGVIIVLMLLFFTFLFKVFMKSYSHVQIRKPSRKFTLSQQNSQSLLSYDSCALFRVVPALKGKVAWVKLVESPTPIHTLRIELPKSRKQVEFLVKREDLSSPLYGGNKTRTLEFLLPSAAIMCEEEDEKAENNNNNNKDDKERAHVIALGEPHSNQPLATAVFARKLGIPYKLFLIVNPPPYPDNALNLLSMVSFTDKIFPVWANPIATATQVTKLLWYSPHKVLPGGGANPVGCLGQMSAALELAEQVQRGELKEPEHIFLPIGSSCTISGIILGILLAKKLGIGFKNFPRIHCAFVFNTIARVWFLWRMIVKKLTSDTAKLLSELGGPVIDKKEIESVIYGNIEWEKNYALFHGVMTEAGEISKSVFEKGVFLNTDKTPQKLWVCSSFTSKSAAALIDFLEKNPTKSSVTLLWQTKSVVQPHGDKDSWAEIQKYTKFDKNLMTFLKDSKIEPSEYLNSMHKI